MVQLLTERSYLSVFDCDLQSMNMYGAENLAPCWKTKKYKISYTYSNLYTEDCSKLPPLWDLYQRLLSTRFIHRKSRGSQPVKE
jgi:hypothetical protein